MRTGLLLLNREINIPAGNRDDDSAQHPLRCKLLPLIINSIFNFSAFVKDKTVKIRRK